MADGRQRRLFVATKSFATVQRGSPPGVLLTVREGDLIYEGDTLLKTHGDWFRAVDEIEQTTQGPGERRFVRLPRRERGSAPARGPEPSDRKEATNAPPVSP